MTSSKFRCAAVLIALTGAFGLNSLYGGKMPAAPKISGAGGASLAIQDDFITTTDGAQIHYLHAGERTSAPAIVFIPGWTLSASLWRQELERLAPTRLAIAVESRSQGESSKMLTGNTPERRAKDLRELMSALHVSKFVIVGWSQGAQDVAAYIQEYGTDSLAGVVFVDTAISAGPAEIEIHKEFSTAILSRLSMLVENPDDYSEGLVRGIFSKPHPELDIQHVIEEWRKTPSSIGMAMLVMDIFGADRRPVVKKIDKPTLVIASSLSPLMDAEKEMAAEIPGAQLVVVQGSGHAVFIDEPEKFDDALGQLLKRTTE